MRVLQYTTSLTRSAGGLYYSVSGLSQALRAHGVDVTVMGGKNSYFPADKAIWDKLPTIPLSMRIGGYGFDPRAFLEIKRLKPDLVHIHGIWSAGSIYGRWASAMDIPVVVSPRGMLDPWILARRPQIKAIHSKLFETPMLRNAYVHALNESERESVISFLPSLKDRVFVVPNGISDVDPSWSDVGREGVLYIGRLHAKKQVLELIQFWKDSPGAAGQSLTIAGWGDSVYEAAVRDAAAQTSNIRFVGSLYGDAKISALRKARYFILPSLSEGLPMAVLEAIQFGCIPIVTKECNLPELFDDKIAFSIRSDFTDFDETISALALLPDSEIDRLSTAASRYSRRYRWSSIATDIIGHYKMLLGK